jgi:hypothetical protein
MVSRGQTTTEFVLMMMLMTLIGAFMMERLTGNHGRGGAVTTMTRQMVPKIAQDE